MLPIVPKTETRFWRIFWWLLLSFGAVSILPCIVMAIVTGIGEAVDPPLSRGDLRRQAAGGHPNQLAAEWADER